MLVHHTQELVHVGGQQVVHLIALDRGWGGVRDCDAGGQWGLGLRDLATSVSMLQLYCGTVR